MDKGEGTRVHTQKEEGVVESDCQNQPNCKENRVEAVVSVEAGMIKTCEKATLNKSSHAPIRDEAPSQSQKKKMEKGNR